MALIIGTIDEAASKSNETYTDSKEINFYSQNGTHALSVDVSKFSDKGQINDGQPRDLTGVWRHDDETYYIHQIGNEVWWLQVIFPPDGDVGLYRVYYGTISNNTVV